MKRFHIVLKFLIILTVPGGTNAVAAGVPCSVSDIEAFLLDTESACGNNFNETAPLTQLDAFTFSGVYAYTAIAHDADNSLFTFD